jgi:phage tail sheath protein FI
MADRYHHGISLTEISNAPRIIATVATAVIGLVATAPAAAADAFPLDRPVLVRDLDAAIVAAGAGGTLAATLSAIAATVRTPIVVVRVAPGADAAATQAAIIGTQANGLRTGMQALLGAEAATGVKPRILAVPGLENAEITQALAEVAEKLRGMSYAKALGDDVAAAEAYAGGFTSRALMLLWPDVTVRRADGTTVPSFAAAHAVAMRALIDQEQGWHKTLSNVPLPAVTAGTGVVGITRDVTFDIQDPDCDANVLNAANVTTLVRINGELRFWGSRTTANDANFAFESATRTAQILADTIAGGLVWAIDKPLTPGLARDIVEQCNAKFRAMKQAGVIFGAQAVFDAAKNPVDKLRTGILTIGYRYTPVPPLERLNLVQEISDEFLANFADLVANG